MVEKEIPIPYKVILKRLWRCSDFGKVGTRKARIILVQIFRMERENVFDIIEEMNRHGFIELLNHKFIRLVVPLEELI